MQQETELIVSPFTKTLSNLTHHDKIMQEEACRRTGKGDSQGQVEEKEKRHGVEDKEQALGERHEQVEPKEDLQNGRRYNNINKVIARGERADTAKTFTEGGFWRTTKKSDQISGCADDAVDCELAFDDRVKACCDFDEWTRFEVAIAEKEQGLRQRRGKPGRLC